MAIYGEDHYGYSVYGHDGINNLFYDWLPRIHKLMDVNTELQRFLQIFSYTWWLRKYSIDSQLDLFNVYTCPVEYLPFLAYLVGVDYNYDLPDAYARQEIATAVPFYKLKGTVEGVQYFVKSITGWDSSVVFKGFGYIMMTNTIGDYTLNVNDGSNVNMPLPSVYSSDIDTPADIIRYTVDAFLGTWWPSTYWLILQTPDDDTATLAKTQKLNRVSTDFSPITTRLDSIIAELLSLEVFDETTITESFESESITEFSTEDSASAYIVQGIFYDMIPGIATMFTNDALSLTDNAFVWTAQPGLFTSNLPAYYLPI